MHLWSCIRIENLQNELTKSYIKCLLSKNKPGDYRNHDKDNYRLDKRQSELN